MGLYISRFDEIKFDESYFDYYYDTDPFKTDSQDDFESILLENGDMITLVKQTDTKDSMGTVSAVTETEYYIYVYISDITKKDRQINEMGIAEPGDRIMYTKDSYEYLSAGTATSTWEVEEGDVIKDRNDIKWRVVKLVHEPYFNDKKIYKKFIIRNIGL